MSKVNQINTAGLRSCTPVTSTRTRTGATTASPPGSAARTASVAPSRLRATTTAYDLARNLKRNNWNSYGGWSTTPKGSITWGDHVDHVYVKPSRSNVYQWMNAALDSGSSYTHRCRPTTGL